MHHINVSRHSCIRPLEGLAVEKAELCVFMLLIKFIGNRTSIDSAQLDCPSSSGFRERFAIGTVSDNLIVLNDGKPNLSSESARQSTGSQ